MYFETFAEALTMDGHGLYVWLAYGVCFVVMAWMLLSPLRRRRALLQQLAAVERRAQANVSTDTDAGRHV